MANQKNKAAPRWADGEYVGELEKELTLLKPIKITANDPNEVTSLKLREPTVAELKLFQSNFIRTNNEIEAGAVLVQKVTGLTAAQMDAMGQRDFKEALDFLMGFTKPDDPSSITTS